MPDRKKLRSAEWFGTADKNGFMYRSWMKNQGIPDHEFQGKPIIGKLEGRDIGSGTAVWQLHESLKAGEINLHQFLSAESGMSRSAGSCNTMGTASTMACMAEALGASLPHNAAIPAVDSRRYML